MMKMKTKTCFSRYAVSINAMKNCNNLGSPSNDERPIDIDNCRFITLNSRELQYCIVLRQWNWYKEDEILDTVKEYMGNNEAERLYNFLEDEDYPIDDISQFIPLTEDEDEYFYYELKSESGDLIEEGKLDIGELIGHVHKSPDESSPKFILLHKDSIKTVWPKFELPANMTPNDVHFFSFNWSNTPFWAEVTDEAEVDLSRIYANGLTLELDYGLDGTCSYGDLKFALFQLKQRKRNNETIEYYYEKIMDCED